MHPETHRFIPERSSQLARIFMWKHLLVLLMGGIEDIELLARSKHRVRILDLLCEHGSLEKHVLGDRLDASRTTVGRNLNALEEQG